MDNSNAIKPDMFHSFMDLGTQKEKNAKGSIDPDEQALAALSNHDGWRVLNEYIETLKNEIDNLISTGIASGATFEEIGKITIVGSLTKEKLNAIQQRVGDAREVTGN